MMKKRQITLFFALVLALLSVMGCHIRLPGQPLEAERWQAPSQVSDFNKLYQQNCAGCHGADGRRGAARSLNDPLYLSFVTDIDMLRVVARGRAGTNMPAFSQQAGGTLTDQQISLLITGMRSRWARPDDFKGLELPRYSVTQQAADTATTTTDRSVTSGDALKGAAAFKTYCARCHGEKGAGGSAGSIVDQHFLNLVSDQNLRTSVVVGRADWGKPDWRSNLPGHPMSPQEIDDVVAWLIAQRQTTAAVTASQVSQANLK